MEKVQTAKAGLLKRVGIEGHQIFYLLAANICSALALNLFYVGNNIAAGGLAGIGTILNYFFKWPIGLTVFLLNMPIALCAIGIKGKAYAILTLMAMGVYSLVVDLLSFLPCITDDKIVAVVFGGILYGTSAAFAIKARLSTGGTDLLAKLLITKFKTLTIGTLFMIIDGSIVVMAMLAYKTIDAGIYALLAIVVSSLVTDKLSSGFNRAQMFYIFTDKNTDEITNAILYEIHRGVTSISAKGKYSGSDKEILFVVVKPSQTPKLKAIVRKYDPTAFMVLVSANEIIGNGFEDVNLTQSIKDKT